MLATKWTAHYLTCTTNTLPYINLFFIFYLSSNNLKAYSEHLNLIHTDDVDATQLSSCVASVSAV